MQFIETTVLRPAMLIWILAASKLQAQTKKPSGKSTTALPDALEEAQTSPLVKSERDEQTKTSHDVDAAKFNPGNALPVNAAVKDQLKEGAINGFDFYRDPIGADKLMQALSEIMTADKHDKDAVMDAQRSSRRTHP